MKTTQTNILILGGGFAGVKTALELAKKEIPNTKITLVSDRSNFEYHGALYRLVAGHSPQEVCLPLADIFEGLDVDLIKDRIVSIDPAQYLAQGEVGHYRFDSLVLALGSETNYFGIEGLKEHSYGMKTIREALELKRHVHDMFERCKVLPKDQQHKAGTIAVVGAGATGVEIAAELAVYAKQVAKLHGVDESLVTIELVEAADRILPMFSKKFTNKIEEKLRSIGVNVHVNRPIQKEEVEEVFLQDMQMKTKTVIWTAGVKASHLLTQTGIKVDRQGRAIVNHHMQVKGHRNVYAAGDAAATSMSGMAQTALYDAKYIADILEAKLYREPLPIYNPPSPIYAIPVGQGWSGTKVGPLHFYGHIGWVLRRLVDMVVYVSFLPLPKAVTSFMSHKKKVESCDVCKLAQKKVGA